MSKFSLKHAQYAVISKLKQQKCHKKQKKQSAKKKSVKNKPKKQANFNENKPNNKQPTSLQTNPQLHKNTSPN